MKKFLAMILILVLTLSLVACGGASDSTEPNSSTDAPTEDTTKAPADETSDESSKGGDVAIMISAAGTLDDKAFNTACWLGMQDFAAETGKTYTYYQPTEDTVESQMVLCDTAVKAGAEFIIINSDQFKLAATQMQETYPDVTFIIYDTIPENEDGEQVIADNMCAITFAEEQCAYIAGYAAVVDGHTKLGYLGGMAVPAVVRFGYGYLAGVDQAAEDLGIEGIEVLYNYFGNFEATPDNQAKAASWYQNGTEVIFVAAGPAGASVFAAAEQNDGLVIGVDSDQSAESDTIISSAMKDLRRVTYNYLMSWHEGTFEGGKVVRLTAAEEGVGLPMETSKWSKFSQEDYDKLYERLAKDEGGLASSIPNDKTAEEPTDIELSHIKLTYVE
jgi:basic membrane protein A